jgi:hypothetical protein
MRSAIYNFLVISIALALFVPASRLLRRAPTDGYLEAKLEVAPDANLKGIVLPAATIERPRQWRFKPGTTSYVKPNPWVVPPPPNHESTRWVKKVS